MKLLSTLILLSLFALKLGAAELVLFGHHLLPDPAVRLYWEIDASAGLQGFEIERSTDNEHFQTVSQRILCNGGLDYSFTDYPLDGMSNSPIQSRKGLGVDQDQTYYYRLVFLGNDNSRLVLQDDVIQVEMQLNTVSTTWGSIKAMFR